MARQRTARPPAPLTLLRNLEAHKAEFGGDAAEHKLALLVALANARLPSADAVSRLHEALCFLRAHPDSAALLGQVTAMLDRFAERSDLRRFRKQLADTGIAGTTIRYSFFADTARWLSQRFPGALQVVWQGYEQEDLLSQRLPLLATWPETPGLDEISWPAQEWVRRLAGPDTSDADFLITRCQRLGGSAPTPEEALQIEERVRQEKAERRAQENKSQEK